MINNDEIQKGIALSESGNIDEAEKVFTELLKKNPDNGTLLSVIGLFYVSIANYEKAVDYLNKACRLKESLGTVAALGFAEYSRRNYAEAAKVLEHALSFGENVDIYNKLILSLFEIRSYKKAIEYTDKMCELYPDSPKAIANKIKSLTQSGKLIDAERICVEYLKKNPKDAVMWHHLGLLKELIYSDYEQAIECHKIAQENGNLNADYNIAVAYQNSGNFEKAEEHYNNFLKNFPNDENGMTSLGMCYLSQKRFKEGYELFCRRKKGNAERITNNLWIPDIPLDNNLIIICDQGFGDQIQFVRYLPFLKKHKIKVAVSKPLKRLFEKNYSDIEFVLPSEIDPSIQAVRITDLAYALNIDFDNIPFSEGYLNAEPSEIDYDKPKIGLCWEAGSAGIRGMINRTINVKCFEPLFEQKNIQLYSFQYTDTFNGNERYPQMVNLTKNFEDFYDTASALKAMDAVVTVDTSVAHLAGALGVKTYLLLPYAPDWRWFRGGGKNGSCYQGKGSDDDTTIWYKSVRIFIQENPISWEEPIGDIINILIN